MARPKGGKGCGMRRATIGIGLLMGALTLGPATRGADLAGVARVSDGDTLVIGDAHVRLFGIDAPEKAQTCVDARGRDWACGAAARARLTALVAGQRVHCAPMDRDRYDRTVARCRAGGRDLGGVMVAEGLAWAYTRYSVAYVETEALARADRRGLWQGEAQVAWSYRARAFVPASGGDDAADRECRIKGNINARGERIYHTPDSRWYARVHVNEAKGQRWFCDETEARAAGWRPVGGGG